MKIKLSSLDIPQEVMDELLSSPNIYVCDEETANRIEVNIINNDIVKKDNIIQNEFTIEGGLDLLSYERNKKLTELLK